MANEVTYVTSNLDKSDWNATVSCRTEVLSWKSACQTKKAEKLAATHCRHSLPLHRPQVAESPFTHRGMCADYAVLCRDVTCQRSSGTSRKKPNRLQSHHVAHSQCIHSLSRFTCTRQCAECDVLCRTVAVRNSFQSGRW